MCMCKVDLIVPSDLIILSGPTSVCRRVFPSVLDRVLNRVINVNLCLALRSYEAGTVPQVPGRQ